MFLDHKLSVCLVMNTRESLQRLVALSGIERAHKTTTTIVFHPVVFSDFSRKRIYGGPIAKAEKNELEEMTSKKKLSSSKTKALDANMAKLNRDRRARRRRSHERQKRHEINRCRCRAAY